MYLLTQINVKSSVKFYGDGGIPREQNNNKQSCKPLQERLEISPLCVWIS